MALVERDFYRTGKLCCFTRDQNASAWTCGVSEKLKEKKNSPGVIMEPTESWTSSSSTLDERRADTSVYTKVRLNCNYHQQIQLRHSIKFIEVRMASYFMIRKALEKKIWIGIVLPLKMVIMQVYKYPLYIDYSKWKILVKTVHEIVEETELTLKRSYWFDRYMDALW